MPLRIWQKAGLDHKQNEFSSIKKCFFKFLHLIFMFCPLSPLPTIKNLESVISRVLIWLFSCSPFPSFCNFSRFCWFQKRCNIAKGKKQTGSALSITAQRDVGLEKQVRTE